MKPEAKKKVGSQRRKDKRTVSKNKWTCMCID